MAGAAAEIRAMSRERRKQQLLKGPILTVKDDSL
jgi:hypothetical protein